VDLAEVWERARQELKGICSLCRVCDGVVCAGQVPGMGGIGSGAGFQNNVTALARVQLNMRTLHAAARPNLKTSLFGVELSLPVLGAPMAGAGVNFRNRTTEEDMSRWNIIGAYQAGTLGSCGQGPDPRILNAGLAAMAETGGAGIPVIKPTPWEEMAPLIEQVEKAGCTALGMDIDAAGLINMRRAGYEVGPKTADEIARIVSSTKLPFILKGIMTVDEAKRAADAGVAGIVVSNHGGRCLDGTPGTADVLPAIAQAVKGRAKVLMDGGIRSGVDVLKALALGADAVLVGRPIIAAGFGGGVEGVRLLFDHYRDQLETAMILTGCQSIGEIGPHIIYQA
jgi:4-hydroxymandelate oxidase